MRIFTADQLKEVKYKHLKWLNNEEGGERANLRSADLRYADLRSADLRSADLSYAGLSETIVKEVITLNPFMIVVLTDGKVRIGCGEPRTIASCLKFSVEKAKKKGLPEDRYPIYQAILKALEEANGQS